MKRFLSLTLLPLLLSGSAVCQAATLADSAADFNVDGEQGVGGWSYGYRLVEADDDRENYDATEDFLLFDEAGGWVWDGAKWDKLDGNPPWTEVSASGGHPNGTNNGEEHWAIRRWEVDVPNEQALALTWHLHKNNTNGGNGTSGSVHLNGQRVDFASVAGNDGAGFDRTVYVNVKPGDFIDFALLPEGADGDPADGADGSAFWIVMDDSIPGNPTQPDGTPFTPVDAADEDEDGIPDGYETAFFPGDLTQLSADGDADQDGVTDLQEFQGGTNPTDPDTDADGFSDGEEIAAGTDPRNPAINPGIVADSIEDWNIDGEHDPAGWSSGYRNVTVDKRGDDYDAEADVLLFEENDDWTWTGAAWDALDGNPPWTIVAAESTHPNGDNSGDIHWTIRRWAPQVEAPTPFALIWSVRKENVNCGNGVTGSLHINGERVDFLTVASDDGDGATRSFYATVKPGDLIDVALSPLGTDGSNNDGCDGSLTSLKVSRGIPTPAIQPDGETIFIPPGAGDTDGDQLADVWEFGYFPDDLTKLAGDGDFDGDGSTDLEELNRNTDPTKADTDADTLLDGVETDTGVFVSVTDTGTDPKKQDTDGDGLADNVEIAGNPATDPTKSDTDGDGDNDKTEIDGGTDPNDPADNSKVGVIASSEDDWSRDGIQGANSWFYGYRDLTEEGDPEKIDYDPQAEFIPYPQDWWNGNTWDFPDGDVPWTFHGAAATHPNGDNNGSLHWSVRRWEANTDDPTAVAIRWFTAKSNTNCGNGVTGAIHVNGVRIDSLTIASNDGDGEERVVYANVEAGDTVDLINSPFGEDETNNDGCDGTTQWMTIGTRIPDPAIQPDGSVFEPVILGDPSLSFSRRTPFGQLGDSPGVQTRTVTLKNPGETQDLVISAATLVGPESDHYSTDLALPLTLTPEASHEFTVTFDPRDTDGGFIASLEFTSNDENKAMRTLDLNANIPDRNKMAAWYKLDETAGTRLNDSSGNGNHGTFLPNGGTIALGQPGIAGGTSVQFAPDGANAAYGEVPNFPIIEGGFTISMWFQADAGLGAVAGLISKNDGPDSNGRPFALASAENRLNWFGEGIPDIAGGEASAIATGQVQHVSVTYDPAAPTVRIFVDGAQTELLEDASVINDVKAALQIGAVNSNFGFSGRIDDVQIYGKILSAEDVAWLKDHPGKKLGQGDEVVDPPTIKAAISQVSKSAAGVAIGLTGATDASVDVEYSEDLINWDIIANGVSGETYEDSDSTRLNQAAGYYRLRE